ncbi:hypothetical protein DMB38_13015 [Streptomyces sp. WAC 06738]|uniref:hypothetical protein n=1 Tax=Streptomyces sp. WAC 06738 TaxID=2203210 RepID=UPI000F6DBA7D|nr:hypothetical protein [Streptomyces sp. WAC 06738]AZM46613.1 hypothetical protein DMB38_13015 [Streptomyces sp. WAC 06738]
MSTQTTERAVQPLTPSAQLGPALALVELLKQFPGLPAAEWCVDQYTGELSGHLYRSTFDKLTAFAEVLGGEIAPGRDYEFRGEMLRPHRLRSVWQDVRVVITATMPAPVAKAVAA